MSTDVKRWDTGVYGIQYMEQDPNGAFVEHEDYQALLAENERLRGEMEKAERSLEHTYQWYAVRLEKIKEVAKRVGLWSEVAAIIANGSSSIYDPPTYAQTLNIAKHETKAAEARAERLEAALQEIERQMPDQAGPAWIAKSIAKRTLAGENQ